MRFGYERGDGQRVTREVDALALGLKAGLWYLVGRVDAELRVYRVSRISRAELADSEFARDPGFDLRAFWTDWVAASRRASLLSK